MSLLPLSKKYFNEFLSRDEDNFHCLIDKIMLFHEGTREEDKNRKNSRRSLKGRFHYDEQLQDVALNQQGISTKEVVSEFNEMLEGCLRHQDPTTAFNIIPAPMLDVVAGLTMINLYNPNTCWDFISGKICLFEKKIVRMLGNLVNWPKAEGVVVTGGKQTLTYAIKNGMSRAGYGPSTKMEDFVVICSELAHYSIEHVCYYLGMKPENCVRVKAKPSGEMDSESLEKTMKRVLADGKRIAAVLGVGGATINLVPDSIISIKETIDRVTRECALEYTPYFHVDSVISWTWLSFSKAPNDDWKKGASPEVVEKINAVLSQLSGMEYADSFGVDFHKTGFCPYAAGVFVARDESCIVGMPSNDALCFGENEVYRYTLENSRSGLAIAAIWIALRRMGLAGLRDFVLYQLEVCERFKQKIRDSYSDHFEILNEHSLGWEIVLKPHFKEASSWDYLLGAPQNHQLKYIQDCHHFLNALWYEPLESEGSQVPIIGFVRSYSRSGSYEKKFPAFLIHPTSLHYDENTIDEMLEGLVQAKMSCSTKETSEEYLYQCTPPR